MDPDLILIFGFVLAIAALALLAGRSIHGQTIRHEARKLELQARTEEAKASRNGVDAEAYARLEARLRVLERIVTDRGYDVATQIEALRDQREVDEDPADSGVPIDGLRKETV